MTTYTTPLAPRSVSKWERGVRSPQGPSVKLLELLLAEADATKND